MLSMGRGQRNSIAILVKKTLQIHLHPFVGLYLNLGTIQFGAHLLYNYKHDDEIDQV